MSRISVMAAALMGLALYDLTENGAMVMRREWEDKDRQPEPTPEPEPTRPPGPPQPFTGELPPKMPVPPKRRFTKRERKAMQK